MIVKETPSVCDLDDIVQCDNLAVNTYTYSVLHSILMCNAV